MHTLESYARELVNISYSEDDSRDPTPPRLSTTLQNTTPKQTTKKPVEKPRSSLRKTGKTPAKTKQSKAKLEEMETQLEWFRKEYERVLSRKQQLKSENQRQNILIGQLKAKLEQTEINEGRLLKQLSEQTDVTKSALRQASDAQINLESSKANYILQLQQEETSKLRLKEDLENTFQRQIELKKKQAISDVERKYEGKLQQVNREVELLRLENIELHRRLTNKTKNESELQKP